MSADKNLTEYASLNKIPTHGCLHVEVQAATHTRPPSDQVAAVEKLKWQLDPRQDINTITGENPYSFLMKSIHHQQEVRAILNIDTGQIIVGPKSTSSDTDLKKLVEDQSHPENILTFEINNVATDYWLIEFADRQPPPDLIHDPRYKTWAKKLLDMYSPTGTHHQILVKHPQNNYLSSLTEIAVEEKDVFIGKRELLQTPYLVKGLMDTDGRLYISHSNDDHTNMHVKSGISGNYCAITSGLNVDLSENNYDLRIAGPEIAFRLLRIGFDPNTEVKLEGHYIGFGRVTSHKKIGELVKGLSLADIHKPISLEFSGVDTAGNYASAGIGTWLVDTSHQLHLGIVGKDKYGHTYEIANIDGSKQTIIKEELQHNIHSGSWQIEGQRKPYKVTSRPEWHSPHHTILGIFTTDGQTYYSSTAPDHPQLRRTVFKTPGEVIAHTQYDPSTNTWLIYCDSGKLASSKTILDQIIPLEKQVSQLTTPTHVTIIVPDISHAQQPGLTLKSPLSEAASLVDHLSQIHN